MKTKIKLLLRKLLYRPRWQLIVGGVVVIILVCSPLAYQNINATVQLHKAIQKDKYGQYDQAQTILISISKFLILPNVAKQLRDEKSHNAQLISNTQKLVHDQQLLQKSNGPQIAMDTSDTTGTVASPNTATAPQQQTGNTVKPKSTTSTSTSNPASSPTSSPAPPTNPTPSSPGPMSAITINSFSATASPATASTCTFYESVNFSVNGSGSVQVTWKELSSKTASSIENPYTYTFSAAGSQSDAGISPASFPGLQPGDSYRVSVIITNTTNGTISASAGPVTISTCAAPQALMSPNQPSFMSNSVTPGSLTVQQNQDSQFVNMCNVNVQAYFSVSGPGSVQAVYTITSGSSIGDTVYGPQQWTFTGSGSAIDSSYTRLPHLPSGDHYTITVKLNVLGDPGHSASAGPITSNCD